MVDDPYTFGKIAATNALSDVYAMGGEVRTALNIVCFPEKMDMNVLGEIMRGGSEKVIEAGGTLVGGHSIADSDVKYGLSVMGVVHPEHILANNTGRAGDKLILTKRLGVGIICTANRVGEASEDAMEQAIASMTTLNKYAAEICRNYPVHACTDVTGFGFLGHLHEMLDGRLSCRIEAGKVPVFPEALKHAEEFLLTAAGQRNRNYIGNSVKFEEVSFAMEEVLFDPQTSGGLLVAVEPKAAGSLEAELQKAGLPAAVVGELLPKEEQEIYVIGA
jgi:selenide,water dikinase